MREGKRGEAGKRGGEKGVVRGREGSGTEEGEEGRS